MMNNYSKWLFRIAAIYSLIGALLGADLAGRQDYTLVPGHGHILVVGWLTLFAYGIFYKVHKQVSLIRVAKWHATLSMIGGGLMPLGMLLYNKMESTATLLAFIIPATILLIAIGLFLLLLFFDKKLFASD